ncbi:hypothetical protein GA0061094_3447 [[Bacillus] enclensis]|uniref:Uncharacterized protein n=2 Tax=[Bacillus] enclensis TaxID=1402860 RepID=A0A1C4D0S1_9BACI|nr:hypothetical protein GA0061094_3447 [[Bacillus] enclensis]
MIGVQDEDSCGKSETGETPQERSDEEAHRPPAESEVLHGNQLRYCRRIFNKQIQKSMQKNQTSGKANHERPHSAVLHKNNPQQKGANIMSKKLLSILSGSALAAMLLVGCNANDQEPPPEDNNVEDNGNVDEDGDIDDNDMNDNDMNGEHYPESEDKNTPNDKDPAKDNNTPEEDAVEDDIDMNDKDNKDE